MSDGPVRPVRPKIKLTSLWYDPWYAPFQYLEWCMEWVVYYFSKLAIFKILEYAAKLAIAISLILYITECDDRKRQAELNAWQTINSAQGQKGASGRVEAIEDLNKTGVDLSFLSVPAAYLRGINLSKGKLSNSDFSESELDSANFSNAELVDSKFYQAGLSNADFSSADLRGARFDGAKLSKSIFRNADLRYANLQETDIENANLSYANLNNAIFYNAKIKKADFSGADMNYINFYLANLEEANLAGANLSNADLLQAILKKSNLSNTNLNNARLMRTDLRETIGITFLQLCNAKTLYGALLNPTLLEMVKAQCPEKLERTN